MKLFRNRPLRFAVQFVPLFLVCLWLYPRVLPSYRLAAQAGASAVMTRLSPPTSVETHPAGGFHAFVIEPSGEKRSLSSWTGFVVHLIFLGLLFLPPLLLSSPTSFVDRLRLLIVGLALLYVLHVLSLVGLVRGRHCLLQAPGTTSCMWLLRVVYTSGQLSGAVLWAALTWRFWVPESWLRREPD